MKKFIVVVVIASFVLLSGCATIVEGSAAMMGKSASDHPATKSFVVGMAKNDAFNASMRALTAKGRKVTSSDREAGVVQGDINENAVTIKIAGKGSKESTIDITVAFVKTLSYGSPKLEDDLNTLVAEINQAVKNAPAIAALNDVSEVPEAVVATPKKKHKKISVKAAQ